ncbi:DUF3783 domain-containing protein [Anaerocolumna sp. AGMB13020]|uniref:DUF3783 domain-containing protein n=1 Tax=Anaerocolumna sp. AGMB13020 TaxID=3081750 RepID=UPI002952BD67|nr:DUF3783 domain-containing protein [Anaerocolumna sp. AGMB13020]WOO36221.1 DUF3783 domain-containing protein [Anaerocolumna sp. AGMB13020]
MKETVLLFNITSRESRLKIGKALLPMNIAVKAVATEEYSQSIGYLAGMKDRETRIKVIEKNVAETNVAETNAVVTNAKETNTLEGNTPYDNLAGEMIVMAGLTASKMELVLQAFRKAGILKSCLKAVLTDTNRFWNAFQLYEEQKREYDKMNNVN